MPHLRTWNHFIFDGSDNIKLGDDEGVLEAAAVVRPMVGKRLSPPMW